MKKNTTIFGPLALLITTLFLLICCEREEQIIITEGQLVGTWSFEKFQYNNVEYLSTDADVCNLISQNLGNIWYINTGFICEWSKASLSGRDIVKWTFHDNCSQRTHWPPEYVQVSPYNKISVAGYGFKAISYKGGTLVLKIISSNASSGFPQLPIGGIYTFQKIAGTTR